MRQTSRKRTKAKRTREVPGGLGFFIELANGLPLDARTEAEIFKIAFARVDEAERKKNITAAIDISQARWIQMQREEAARLQGAAQEYVGVLPQDYDSDQLNLFRFNYAQLFRLRDFLRSLAKLTPGEFTTIMTDLTVSIDEQSGVVRFSYPDDDWLAVTRGVDARRIRQCPVCSKIFWAGRLDQTCCGSACGHAWRNREYRSTKKRAQYANARAAQRLQKKELQTKAGTQALRES